MKSFQILKPGTFTAKDGTAWTFTAEQLAEAATGYNPELSEAPLVVGHPEHDKPAYGWVKGLKVIDGVLTADPDQVDPAFSEMVEAGRFKQRSASLWAPGSKGNPTPGKWYLKHIGFLGAVPPAVKGLKSVAFSAEDDGAVEFSDAIAFSDTERTIGWALRNMATIARSFRDYILSRDGEDEADKLIPNYAVDQMVADAARIDALQNPSFSTPEPDIKDTTMKTQAELDAQEAALTTRETEIAARETAMQTQSVAFSQAARATRRKENDALLDGLVKAGKFAPGFKAATLDFMDGLDAEVTVEFSEGDGKVKKTPAAFFAALLEKSGTVVNFSEVSEKDKEDAGLNDPQALADAAVAFQEDQRSKGIEITIEQAVRKVATKA